MQRREFIKDSLLGLTALAGSSLGADLLRAEPLNLPIGLQVYSIRDECEKDFEAAIKKVAAIGYKAVELYTPFFNKQPSEMLRILKENGLSCPSAHFMKGVTEDGWNKHVEYAQALGMRYMLAPGPESVGHDSLDDYRRMADFFNKLGERCKKAGMQFAYHNHNFEFKQFDGVIAYDELLRRADPELVKMQLDCFWVTRAGKDPVDYLTKHPGRFPLLHIKDLKPGFAPVTTTERQKVNPFTEVGHGIIDWKRIFKAAPAGGVKQYYVEQDVCDRPSLESVQISYQYLRGLVV